MLQQLLWGVNFAVAKFGLDTSRSFVAMRFAGGDPVAFVVGLPKRGMLKQLPPPVTMGAMHPR
jgi:hypothetical protein